MAKLERLHSKKEHTPAPLSLPATSRMRGDSFCSSLPEVPSAVTASAKERGDFPPQADVPLAQGVCFRRAAVGIVLVLTSLLLFAACASTSTKQYPADSFTIDGVMHHTNLEGGCWVFKATDGQSYELTGKAAKDLLREGLRAEIIVEPRPDLRSVCMVGRIVEVIEIKEIHSNSSPR
jgi:hypothetical protein